MSEKKIDVPELWTACLSGQFDLAKQLIDNGADVNEPTKTQSDNGITMLHYAVACSDIALIRVLADFGADFNARDSKNRTPLHRASLFGVGPKVIELLIDEGSIVDARDYHQKTALHFYARKERFCIESVQMLIARGASLEAVTAMGQSILHVAVWHHNFEMVKMLINHKVNIDPIDNYGRTPLRLYFSNVIENMEREDQTEILQLLLDNGADVNSKSPNSLFPLIRASRLSNRLDSLNILLTRGARVNETTNMGVTALHVACLKGRAEVAALLLKFGADLNARDRSGKTPFQLLRSSPTSEATAQIIIREAVKREALGQSLNEGYTEMAQSCETYSKFDRECREEIKRMQNEKIDAEDSTISFFDIFSIDEEKLVALARNESIVTAFESSGYATSFGIYAIELTTKFEVAKKRANLPAPIVRKLAAYVKYGYIIENELYNDCD